MEKQSIARNKRARYDYEIMDTLEAGLMLTGTEVKSLRVGRASINECYAGPKGDEIYLFNAHIPEYKAAGSHLQHEPRRPRKLLLHKRELGKLMGGVQKKGYTLVPIELYFNQRGLVKLSLGLGRGKKMHDKRETSKDRDWKRSQARILRGK